MTRGSATRFQKGQSGNPGGRPKKERPRVSAFDVIFDQTLTVTQGGVDRELTVDEALQLQTYQAALKGSRMAVRTILKMIAKRETWLAARNPPKQAPLEVKIAHEARSADEALLLLEIAAEMPPPVGWGKAKKPLLKLQPWVVEEGRRRSKRRTMEDRAMEDIRRNTLDPENPVW